MRFRLVSACSIVVVLVILLSFLVSIGFHFDTAARDCWGGIVQGQIYFNTRLTRNVSAFAAQERFTAELNPGQISARAWFARPVWQPGINGSYSFPLGWILIAAVVLPGAVYLIRWLRISRRLRRGLCLRCGYDLRHSGSVCPECATPRDVPLPLRWPMSIVPSARSLARVMGLAGCLFALVVIVLSVGLWWVGQTDRLAQERYKLAGLDVTRFVAVASPRLSGDVVNRIHSPLSAVDFKRGNLVLLGEGDYAISDRDSSSNLARQSFSDVAIFGVSPQKTRLRLNIRLAHRLRLENLTIDCGNDPCMDFRSSAELCLKNCVIMNYNSGAGGSSAIDGSNTTLLIEDCTFDGNTGRQAGHSMGNAFDLRGGNQVYARNTTFIDNSEISRERCITFDGCGQQRTQARPMSFFDAGARFLRNSPSLVSGVVRSNMADAFTETTDDPTFVQHVLHDSRSDDPLSQRLLDSADFAGDPRYWAALYRGQGENINTIAAQQLSRLKHAPTMFTPASMDRVPALLGLLESSKANEVWQARMEFLSGSPQVIEAIRNHSGPMSEAPPQRLEELNRLLDLSVPLPVEVEYEQLVEKIDR